LAHGRCGMALLVCVNILLGRSLIKKYEVYKFKKNPNFI
jgi:hypothetical protein